MFLVSLAGAVQQIVHSTLLSDRAVDHLINGGLFTIPLATLHTLNRKAGKRADRERKEDMTKLEQRLEEQKRITELALQRMEEERSQADGSLRDMVTALALEVRTLTVMVKNGITDRMDDIRDRMGKMEERELSRAEHHNQRSA